MYPFKWPLTAIPLSRRQTIRKMPSRIRYPDSLRQQAIALSRKGKGYKAISTELGIKRDTVRNWITTYRLTGRTESVQVTGQMRTVQLAQQEELYAEAREEYETSTESLLSIAKKHGLNYNNLRHFLQQHHPESALLHGYVKRTATLRTSLEAQIVSLQQTGEELLRQMREDLDQQLRRVQHP